MINGHEDGGAKVPNKHDFNSASKSIWITKWKMEKSF